MKHSFYLVSIIFLSLIWGIISCSNPRVNKVLDRAESLMETHPDSSLWILNDIDIKSLSEKKQKARYSLLMSMALDKNYIDTTTFDILQPAIDYYLQHGTPDEKIKTYFYQGVLFLNRNNNNDALSSFFKGTDLAGQCVDSLYLARNFVAQGCLYYIFYDFDSYVESYLNAAHIYNSLSYYDHAFDCLINALNGSILSSNRKKADSLLNICDNSVYLNTESHKDLYKCLLSYAISFGTKNDVKEWIREYKNSVTIDPLTLAYAYNKIGENENALSILDAIKNANIPYDTMKYESISVYVHKDMGNYEKAFSHYWDYSHRWDSINSAKFDQKSKYIKEKHEMELEAQNSARQKSQIIWGCLGTIIILLLGIFLLLSLFRNSRIKKELALEQIKAQESEVAHLRIESEKLALENEKLQLEREKQILETQNLTLQIETLENESNTLKSLIANQKDLPEEVQDAIKVRLEMLNSLLATHISSNEEYEKSYYKRVNELTENIAEFMNSNRLAFQVSHPRFIKYLEEHDLSVDEINYLCLYAIGLMGKEVGKYMKRRGHVNMSSAIRKKLGIDRHETYLGIYVKKLLNSL